MSITEGPTLKMRRVKKGRCGAVPGFGDMLSALRRRDGLSQKELAQKAGVSRSAIGMYETGEREPSFETLQLFADIFHVRADTLLGAPDRDEALASNALPAAVPVKKVPLLGTIACGTPVLAQENIADYVDLPGHVRADFALVCRGSSMINAGINDGDIVYIRRSEAVDNGQIAAVLVEGAETEATLKRVYTADGKITLTAENPAFAPLVFVGSESARVRVIGLAVAYTHMLS